MSEHILHSSVISNRKQNFNLHFFQQSEPGGQ